MITEGDPDPEEQETKEPKIAYESPRGERPAVAAGTMPDLQPKRDPYLAFRYRPYRFFAIGNLFSVIGRQMLSVVVGWEVYKRTHSATALGLIGLVQALPLILLAMPAGHVADRFSRKRVLMVTQICTFVLSLGLAALSFWHDAVPAWGPLVAAGSLLHTIDGIFHRGGGQVQFDPGIPVLFGLLLLSGISRTFSWAARASYLPNLVPQEAFANAVTWNSSTLQIAFTLGPALGGFLIAKFGFPIVYLIDGCCGLIFFCMLLQTHTKQKPASEAPPGLRGLFSGLLFVFRTRIVLGTITLDLFAVLFGGATALLPIFADQILHSGVIGLGWLRAAPAIGAFAMSLILAHLPPLKHAGRSLLWAVCGFGVATIVFGLSRSFWLSLVMLALTGAFDNVSVVVRHTLVQLLTPDEMRGRVSAVNNVFIGSSNELGAFESGITAALFGPVLSVVGGGIGTILVVLAVFKKWPEVARFGTFESARPSK